MMKSFFITLTVCLLFALGAFGAIAAYNFIDSLPPVAWPILGLAFVFVLLWAAIHMEMNVPDKTERDRS